MYTTYSTDAIVLARVGFGEADLRIELFTRDFGIVRAKAAGARAEASKLRYSLQTLSLCKVALVSGKRGWRLTGAELLDSRDSSLTHVSRMSRIATLIRSLVASDEPSEVVFDLFTTYGKELDNDDTELALVASILTLLGYLKGGNGMNNTDLFAFWQQQVATSRTDVLDVVNNTLSANHILQK